MAYVEKNIKTVSTTHADAVTNLGNDMRVIESDTNRWGWKDHVGGYHTAAEISDITSATTSAINASVSGTVRRFAMFTGTHTVGDSILKQSVAGRALGVLIAPSENWNSAYNAIQIGATGSIFGHESVGSMTIGDNMVYSSADCYLNSGPASKFNMYQGVFNYYCAVTGTAGQTISWNNAFKIANNGDVTFSSLTDSCSGGYVKASTSGLLSRQSGVPWGDLTSVPGSFTPSAHVLNSATHTVSGLTTGHFLKATGATSFGFAAHGLTYSDVGAASVSHTHTYSDVGADAVGAAATVNSALSTHAGLTTTAHGLGASAFHADAYFSLAGAYRSGDNVSLGTISSGAIVIAAGAVTDIFRASNSDGYGVYVNGNQLNSSYGRNSAEDFYINYSGYNNGATQYRNTSICNGKGATVAFFNGANSNVAIGFTGTIAAKFAINGGLNVGGTDDPGDNNLLVTGKTGIGTAISSYYAVTIAPPTDTDSLSWYDSSGFQMGILGVSNSPRDGYFGLKTHGGNWNLLLAANGVSYFGGGNVGIGSSASAPASMLAVNGNGVSNAAIYGTVAGGYAVNGVATSGQGLRGECSTGYGVVGISSGSGRAGYFSSASGLAIEAASGNIRITSLAGGGKRAIYVDNNGDIVV